MRKLFGNGHTGVKSRQDAPLCFLGIPKEGVTLLMRRYWLALALGVGGGVYAFLSGLPGGGGLYQVGHGKDILVKAVPGPTFFNAVSHINVSYIFHSLATGAVLALLGVAISRWGIHRWSRKQ